MIVVAVWSWRPRWSSGAPPSAATSDVSPYQTPQVVDTNPDPNIVETTIVADGLAVTDIGDGRAATGAMAYNGSIPGPEFHLTVGQRVRVHFENHLDTEATGIHWHGIELENKSDGTPFTQNLVPPGARSSTSSRSPGPASSGTTRTTTPRRTRSSGACTA